jgi:hypothetical protein
VNNHQSAITQIKDIEIGKCPTIVLDRLSICFNDADQERVKKTCGLLIDDHMSNFFPAMTVTTNQRYRVSCRLKLPFDAASQATVCFEAGPRSPGQASYRIDFNPSKLSNDGLLALKSFMDTRIDADPVEFFRGGKVTRCDLAIDLPGFHLEDFIVRTSRLQKHGVYADRYGLIRTTYLGTPTSSRVVAYEKPIVGSLLTRLRLERRLKPRCFGYEVAKLPNPFAKVELIPVAVLEASGLDIPVQFIADSIRIGGLNRALLPLDPAQRKAFRKAYKTAASVMPNLDEAWAAWPSTLIENGLGEELGAVPVIGPCSGILANHNNSIAIDCKPPAHTGV